MKNDSLLRTFGLSLVFSFLLPFAAAAGDQAEAGGAKAQDIFNRKTSWVEKQLKKMSLSDKIGQMLVAHCPARFQSEEDKYYQYLSALVSEGKVGGIMFMKGNTYDAAVLANRFQLLAPRPLLVSADMEKGLAMRIDGATEFPPSMAVSATGNSRLAYDMGAVIAREAKALGIHQSYGPSVDLNSNPQNPIINTRSYGDRIPLTVEMSESFIDGFQSNGMIATAKHFPGHGDVTVDSHIDLPVLRADSERLENIELKPFREAIDHGVMSVMIGHLAVPGITGNLVPATLSWSIVTKLLRKKLGFEGLIVTDALNMKALYRNYTLADISVLAVEAGNDLLLFSPDPALTHRAILDAVETGRLSEKQIDKSVRRILLAKQWLGLDRERLVNLNAIPGKINLESHKTLAQTIANSSITVIQDRNNALPIRKDRIRNILHIILEDKRHSLSGETFSEKLKRTFDAKTIRISEMSNSIDYRNAEDSAARASAIIVSSYVEVLSGNKTLSLSDRQQELIHRLSRSAPASKPLVMISFGTPYLANQFRDVPAFVCTYSSSELSEDAAIKLLDGSLKASGKLPVSLTLNIQ